MKILITNDDGIDAPGIRILENVLDRFGDCITLAPQAHLSGISHQVTVWDPITVEDRGHNRLAVSGTPADCVRLGLTSIAPDVDWVVSGINCGANLGSDIYASGTVAAAREAAFLGTPALALSLYIRKGEKPNWQAAEDLLPALLKRFFSEPPAPETFLNINLPHVNGTGIMPDIHFCRPDTTPYDVAYIKGADGYRLNNDIHTRPRRKGDDIDLCFQGFITVSSIRL